MLWFRRPEHQLALASALEKSKSDGQSRILTVARDWTITMEQLRITARLVSSKAAGTAVTAANKYTQRGTCRRIYLVLSGPQDSVVLYPHPLDWLII